MDSSLTEWILEVAPSVKVYVEREECRRTISMKISSQLESVHSFKVSAAWLVCCGVSLRHFEKVIRNRSTRPCLWSNSMMRRAANGTCVLSVAHLYQKPLPQKKADRDVSGGILPETESMGRGGPHALVASPLASRP